MKIVFFLVYIGVIASAYGQSKEFGYSIYFRSSATLNEPNDEFTVDTAGQVYFTSQQLMRDGTWREPKGMAILEKDERDSIRALLRDSAFFKINSKDVFVQCPHGSAVMLIIHRTDLAEPLNIETTTCATEFNALFGNNRRTFKSLLNYLTRLRDKYRPMYLDKTTPK